jgi:hypothetical protein
MVPTWCSPLDGADSRTRPMSLQRRGSLQNCRAPSGRVPTRLVVTKDGPHPSPELATIAGRLRATLCSPAVPSPCPSPGRTGAANHQGPAVSNGQPQTTTPQVNRPLGWQRDRLNLAYNDEVSLPASLWSARRSCRARLVSPRAALPRSSPGRSILAAQGPEIRRPLRHSRLSLGLLDGLREQRDLIEL